MRVCILGSGLTALTLAKALVNQNIFVDLFSSNKNHKINCSRTIGISKSNFDYFNRDIVNIDKTDGNIFISKLGYDVSIAYKLADNNLVHNFTNKI